MNILVIGELNPDLILQGYQSFPELGKEVLVNDCLLTMGSASAICAVGLARLGNNVRFFGKVGRDTYGDFCQRLLGREGIDTGRILETDAVRTGITVSVTGPTDRALITYLGAIRALTESDVGDSLFEGVQHVHMSSFFMQEGLRPGMRVVFERASRRGLTTSLDPGFDPSERWDRDLVDTLEQVDVFFPNEVELQGITGEPDPVAAVRRLANGRTLVVGKLGRHGALAIDRGELVRVPAFEVTPVDTTGAGDSFNAGFLHYWLQAKPLEDTLRFGAACGALSTLGRGGTTTQPAQQQAEEFMNSAKIISEV